MSPALRLDAIAIVLFALFALLGLRVSRRPLSRLDAQAVVFRGQLIPLAVMFTVSGRGPAMTTACLVSIAVCAALRSPLVAALLIALSQIASQMLVEYAKTLFRRVRPDYWLVGLEAGHSYPSGHATTAVIFFCGWATIVALSALSAGAKTALMAILTAWALGIAWSRLALGAHYFTDVCGGVLFGAAWSCAAFTVIAHFYVILR